MSDPKKLAEFIQAALTHGDIADLVNDDADMRKAVESVNASDTEECAESGLESWRHGCRIVNRHASGAIWWETPDTWAPLINMGERGETRYVSGELCWTRKVLRCVLAIIVPNL